MAGVSCAVLFMLSTIVASITSMASEEQLPLNETEEKKSTTYVQEDTIGNAPEDKHDNKTKKL